MTPATNAPSVPDDAMADLEEMCRIAAEGRVPSPDLERRIRQRSAQARQETVKRFGLQDIGVDIREMRDRR